MHRLKVTNCSNHIEEITLKNGSYTIGRSLNNSIRLESSEISRLHARVLIGKSSSEIIDENSSNGTYVNGNKITSCNLSNGDIIKIGKFDLEFSSYMQDHSNGSSHFAEHNTKRRKYSLIISIFFLSIIFLFLFKYSSLKRSSNVIKSQLMRNTSLYIAEKNKNSLYLGEYTILNLSSMPASVMQAAIIDRNGIIRKFYPPDAGKPVIEKKKTETQIFRKTKNGLFEIYTPIYYNSTYVGSLWILFDKKTIETKKNNH